LRPAGIYFGTRSGKVYGSNNDGKSWNLILEGLPAVTCVKAAVVGEDSALGTRKPTAGKKRSVVTSRKKASARNKRSTGRHRVAAR
jgi:hypothetical protein